MSDQIKAPADTIATLRIQYKSGDGNLTERTVSVNQFDKLQLGGMCHLRRSYRTFYIERIRSSCDLQTGEVIRDTYAFLKDAYGRSTWYSLDRIASRDVPALDILLYVARADGQMRAPERKIIAATAAALSSDSRITEEQVKWYLTQMETPFFHGYKIAVGKINKLGDESIKSELLAATRAIIATQKTVSPGEQEALDYMVSRFAESEPAQPLIEDPKPQLRRHHRIADICIKLRTLAARCLNFATGR